MSNVYLIITSIAHHDHPVLKQFAAESAARDISFIVVGDTKSPPDFHLEGCDYYSIERQQLLEFTLAKALPVKHYARKNLGYLSAISKGADVIIETDDDNVPLENFWAERAIRASAQMVSAEGWVNVYKYFTDAHIWPRGFSLENIRDAVPVLEEEVSTRCPIQQGLADENPDVDAIYRLTQPLPVRFGRHGNIALGRDAFCPFNSQNTTWFKEAFPLLYLPSYCSFRVTDIWRSFIAQRIAWTCGWPILFHQSTVWQKRNDHDLMNDFSEEMPGYHHNARIYQALKELNLKEGVEQIPANMIACYQKMIEMRLIGADEMDLLRRWLSDVGKK
jgi:hypothetical protein